METGLLFSLKKIKRKGEGQSYFADQRHQLNLNTSHSLMHMQKTVQYQAHNRPCIHYIALNYQTANC